MNKEDILNELEKCKNSPYYFATKYLTIKSKLSNKVISFSTTLSEEEFNEQFKFKVEPSTSRCCGRCDGVNDICVGDMVCEEHKERGCEICYEKRRY